MSQSLAAIHVHLVFSTKDRQPLLSKEIWAPLHAELGAISKNLGCQPIISGGVEDHIHLLGNMGRSISVADWVKELKRVSNLWLKDQGREFESFEWQGGYGAFSVSHSHLGIVEEYIINQEDHHRKYTYKEELKALLKKHEIAFDERYLWD